MNDIMRQTGCGVRERIGAPRHYMEFFMESGRSMDGVVGRWVIISMDMVWFWYNSLNLISHNRYLILYQRATGKLGRLAGWVSYKSSVDTRRYQ